MSTKEKAPGVSRGQGFKEITHEKALATEITNKASI